MAKPTKRKVTTKKGNKLPDSRLTHVGWEDVFIAELEDRGNITAACKKANISRKTAYVRKKEDKEFAARWKAALQTAIESLEGEAWRRARDGTDKPVFYLGSVAGYIREYSDTLMIFLLKAHKKKYRDTSRHELTGPNGKPIATTSLNANVDLTDKSDAQLDQMMRRYASVLNPPKNINDQLPTTSADETTGG